MTPSPLCPAAAVGVGGEYPLSASSASERAEADPELRKRRGETTVLTFSGQGWGECLNTTQPGLRACPLAGDDDSGDAAHRCFTMSHSALTPPPPPCPAGNFTNSLVILLLLAMQGATGALSKHDAELTWRLQVVNGARWPSHMAKCHVDHCLRTSRLSFLNWVARVDAHYSMTSSISNCSPPATRPRCLQFGVGAVICACVTLYRWLYLKESEVSSLLPSRQCPPSSGKAHLRRPMGGCCSKMGQAGRQAGRHW